MTVKEFLRQARVIDREIRAKEAQIQRLREQSLRVSAVLTQDKVQTSPNPDPMGNIVADIVDLSNDYARAVSALTTTKRQIQAVIDRLERPEQRAILTDYYINIKTWEQVAVDNNYSWRSVHRNHAVALKEIGIVWHTLDVVLY